MELDKVFIGYDRNEDLVCKIADYTLKNTTNVESEFLIQDVLRVNNLYFRPTDERGSTDFSLTRFLTPFLNGFEGWAIFVDGDFIFTDDLNKIFDDIPANVDDYAVFVVKHDYTPKTLKKMGGKQQYIYPKKNWSSFMLFNCSHPSTKNLTPMYVNAASPADLHQFAWCEESEVGELPVKYNFLAGEYDVPEQTPTCIHFTLGAPETFDSDTVETEYDDLFLELKSKYLFGE